MKKFGTPIRAGPGVASEYVGLAGVGEPSGFCVGGTASDVSSTLSRARPTAERTLRSARLTALSSPVPTGESCVDPFPPPVLVPPPPPPPPLSPPPPPP